MNMATERAENCPRSTDNKNNNDDADDLQKLVLPAEVWAGKSLRCKVCFAIMIIII